MKAKKDVRCDPYSLFRLFLDVSYKLVELASRLLPFPSIALLDPIPGPYALVLPMTDDAEEEEEELRCCMRMGEAVERID